MKIELRDQPFNAWQELRVYEESFTVSRGKYGASSVFVGTMRDFTKTEGEMENETDNETRNVKAMFLEHYPDMTSRYLDKITTEAKQKWDLLDALVLHRVGNIVADETIVLIAAWSAHRNEAFSACRFIIEELKHRAPFWKKETFEDGTQRWVTHNTPKVID